MTRLALVRVPDDAPDPDGLIGWYTVQPPRRYAVMEDPAAWLAWVRDIAPDKIVTTEHVDPAWESNVRRWYAAHFCWPGPDGTDLIPAGLGIRTDGCSRIHAVTPTGRTWESPLDITEAVPA